MGSTQSTWGSTQQHHHHLDHRQATTNINPIHQNHQQWPVPSKPHASPPVARLPVSNLLPRLPASLHHQPEVSRSPTDTSQELSLSVRSVVTIQSKDIQLARRLRGERS